jgi:excinuclease ABC subunit C
VASRVVFINGRPARHLYRLFNIRGNDGGDDYACMEQVLERRFRRLINSSQNNQHPSSDSSEEAWARPDLVVIDGGKGQLTSAMNGIQKAMSYQRQNWVDKQISSIPICALAKGEEHVFIPGNREPINELLDSSSPATLLLRALRDESHRFALNAHRKKRSIRRSLKPLNKPK